MRRGRGRGNGVSGFLIVESVMRVKRASLKLQEFCEHTSRSLISGLDCCDGVIARDVFVRMRGRS